TAAAVLWLALAFGACNTRTPSPEPDAPAAPKPKPTASHAPEPAPEDVDDKPADPKSQPQPPKPLAENEKDDKPVQNNHYLLDGLNDIGPAAPAAAFARGVVMITRSDELEISKLLQPPSKAKKPSAGSLETTARGAKDFWPIARGPAVSATHAYWVSKGRVVRRALGGGDLEVLSSDARDGTRVAVAGPPDVVAYITEPVAKHESLARILLPDGKKLDLTPEGAAASSVSLTRAGEDVIASYIDGRSGMTPVHARKLRVKSGTLDADVVVWVSGATQGMTEIVSVGSMRGSWLALPVERDASHFGLATLALEQEPKMDPPLRWRTYENGLDRSPTAATTLCGAATAIYVRPVDASPTANQELVLSQLTLDETASSEPLATARGFADVSVYPLPEGAMLAYVADRRTWGRLIRCK
ncbi:MAG TPA: hypothetical protein VNG33_18375, partial [Polyangiaceae bacterium]|nr:hypothetical protein [Polyangiaceae bacterium]